MRASGVKPNSLALVSLVITRLAAKSLSGQAFQAVGAIRPESRLELADLFVEWYGRGPVVGADRGAVRRVTGVISRSKNPAFLMPLRPRFWLRTPPAVPDASRLVPIMMATFSRSGPSQYRCPWQLLIGPGIVPFVAPAAAWPGVPEPRRQRVLSGQGWSFLGGQGDLHAREMNASPSPALIAWKAIRWSAATTGIFRLTVVPGRVVAERDGDDTGPMLKRTAWQATAHRQRSSILMGVQCGTCRALARTI